MSKGGDPTIWTGTNTYPQTYTTGDAYPNCYPDYTPYYYQTPPVYPPVYTYVQQVDYGTQARLVEVEKRLAEVRVTLERLMDLLDNTQDEEVCGYSEGEGNCADSRGSRGTALECAPQPKGVTSWPPQS